MVVVPRLDISTVELEEGLPDRFPVWFISSRAAEALGPRTYLFGAGSRMMIIPDWGIGEGVTVDVSALDDVGGVEESRCR